MSDNINLSTSLVDLDNITPKVDISEFSADQIEKMANLILTIGGVVRPIILKKTGIESWEVIAGDFEYYATVKALEIDPDFSETIRAFTIKEEQEENIRKQQEILKDLEMPISETPKNPIEIQGSQVDLTKMLNNLTSSLTKEFNSILDKRLQPITTTLEELSTPPPNPSTPKSRSVNSQPQGDNLIAEKLDNIESKIDRLVPKTNITEIEEILNNQIEVIRQKITNLSKQEALSLLAKTQTALDRQRKAIDDESNKLQKVNLLTVETKEEIQEAFAREKVTTKMINATWEAIKLWKQSGESLTWENLKQQTKKGIGFGKTTYDKLRKIADIP